MNFQQSVDYLLSLGNEVETMKLGLANIRRLLDALGNPQKNYLKVQVAGTNGKGSVCAFLGSICRTADIKTGVYTSPHLVSITERVNIDGADIGESEFGRLATRVREISEKLVADGSLEAVPTYFEQVTAIALLAFAKAKVELAILETGLGGRYDAVTAANSEICAITRIDLDHQEYLGDTLAEIAAEKAAIIRADSKVVALHQSREVEQAIIGRCREVGIDPVWATRKIITTSVDEVEEYKFHVFTFTTEKMNYPLIEPLMFGRHQGENASIAIAVAEILQNEGFDISDFDICIGLGAANHPGRLEWMGRFLLDGAHNPASAGALHGYLDEFVAQPITLVFGAMKDKNVLEMAKILFSKAEYLVLTQPGNTRAMPVEAITKFVPKSFDERRVFKIPRVSEAISKAKAITPENGTILVTGSLYLVGEVKKLLNN